MGRLINADAIVHYQTYDDEHEDFSEHESTIEDFLDNMTDEGCPNPVDAVSVVHGRWKMVEGELSFWDMCSECGRKILHRTPYYDFCPYCGADMRKDGDDEQNKKS